MRVKILPKRDWRKDQEITKVIHLLVTMTGCVNDFMLIHPRDGYFRLPLSHFQPWSHIASMTKNKQTLDGVIHHYTSAETFKFC